MNRSEEQAYILNWVKTVRRELLEPKKRGPKTEDDIPFPQIKKEPETGRSYYINSYKHKVYV